MHRPFSCDVTNSDRFFEFYYFRLHFCDYSPTLKLWYILNSDRSFLSYLIPLLRLCNVTMYQKYTTDLFLHIMKFIWLKWIIAKKKNIGWDLILCISFWLDGSRSERFLWTKWLDKHGLSQQREVCCLTGSLKTQTLLQIYRSKKDPIKSSMDKLFTVRSVTCI